MGRGSKQASLIPAVALALATLLATRTAEAGRPRFPLTVDKQGQRLVDRDGRPFLYHADTAWLLPVKLSRLDAIHYLRDRRIRGFTAVQMTLTGFPGMRNHAGVPPFADDDFARPDERYFSHVDDLASSAEALGLLLAIAPVWSGCCGEGWAGQRKDGTLAPLDRNGPDKCHWFGRWLGARYGRYPNIMWMLGGDSDPDRSRASIRGLARGLKETAPHHLLTYHAAPGRSSTDVWGNEPWLDVSLIHAYPAGVPGRGGVSRDVPEAAHREHRKRPPRPFLLGQSTYEGEHGAAGSPRRVRQQAFGAILGGAVGHAYGSPIWRFEGDWRRELDRPGAVSLGHLRRLLESRPWRDLVPDSEMVTTGAAQTPGDRPLTARASDGAFALVYLPSARRLLVDTAHLGRHLVQAWWWDPRAGTAQRAGLYPAKARVPLAPPSLEPDRDWVLVLDDATRRFPPPGAEPAARPPVVIRPPARRGAASSPPDVPDVPLRGPPPRRPAPARAEK